MYGYYYIALRNKVFHRYNRFYLMFTVALSLLLPLVKIDVLHQAAEQGTAIKVLQAVSMQDEIVIELGSRNLLNTPTLIVAAFVFISLFFAVVLSHNLYKIYRIRKRFPLTKVKGIEFINTDVKETPFSFFNSIFWNNSIDLNSTSGQQIFNHEIAHVKEKHTYDKIFVNGLLCLFWINPVFWLIRKELNMIHEFIADKIALEDGDINEFAQMILSSVYTGKQFSITNNFFYSPIKRRLQMLIKNKNSKVNYISRLLVLPLAALVFMAFALKMKTIDPGQIYAGEAITVIIDAGHGGTDAGAISGGINEKDLTLAIAKEIKNLNTNKNINIILSRNYDQHIPVKNTVEFAIEKKADLFVSIHINSQMGEKSQNGLNVVIPKDDNVYLRQSKLLGSSILQSFKKDFPLKVSENLIQLANGVWVLKANQFPAVLVQAGFITSQEDLAYLTKAENQKTIAQNILIGIENYAQHNLNHKVQVTDTIPDLYYQNKKVEELHLRSNKTNTQVTVTYDDGTKETITKEEADKRGFAFPAPPPPPAAPKAISEKKIKGLPAPPQQPSAPTASSEKKIKGVPAPPPPPAATVIKLRGIAVAPGAQPLYIIDGKEAEAGEEALLNPNQIRSIHVTKDVEAISQYGEKGKNGVILILTVKSEKKVDTTFKVD